MKKLINMKQDKDKQTKREKSLKEAVRALQMTLNHAKAEVQFSMDEIKEKKEEIQATKRDSKDTRRIIAERHKAIRRIEEMKKKAELEEEQRRVEDQETVRELEENAQWVIKQMQRDRELQINCETQPQSSNLEERLRQGKEMIEREIQNMISEIRKHKSEDMNSQSVREDNGLEQGMT